MGVKGARRWNIHEESILKAMYAMRKSKNEIAQVLSRTTASIDKHARRLGLTRPVPRATPIRAVKVTRRASEPEYIDCMPNPFERLGKKYGFDKNFYRYR